MWWNIQLERGKSEEEVFAQQEVVQALPKPYLKQNPEANQPVE